MADEDFYQFFNAPDPKAKPAKPAAKGGGAAPAKEAIPTEDQSSSWTDHAYDLGSNIVHTGADLANAARLTASDAGYGGVADTLGMVANKAYDYSDELAGKLSDKAKKNNEAKALSLDEDSMAMRPKGSQAIHGVNSSLPSMAVMGAGALVGGALGAVAGPGGIAAGAYAGKVGASGFLELGSINRSVYDTLKKMSPEELASAPRYQELLQTTGDPTKALVKLADETGAAYQKGGAFVAGMLDGFGPVSSKISQLVTGVVKKGAKDGLVRAVGKEGLQEGAQSLTENLAKQGAVNQDFGTGFDPMDAAEDTAKGAVTGGVLGGGAHMVPGGHGAAKRSPVAEDQNAALDQHGAEAISTDPNEPVTAAVDRVVEKAKQVAQPAVQPGINQPVAGVKTTAATKIDPHTGKVVPAEFDVNTGQMPQQEAIPTGAPVQGPPQANALPQPAPLYVQGRNIHETFTPQEGPAPANPMGPAGAQMYVGGKPVFGEQQGPQPRANGTQPAQQELEAMPFLQAMADENNGVIDPRRIAAYLSSRGQTATWQDVMGELTPLVQQGVLQQSTIPGNQGQPVFSMSTERQGPQAPAQGPHLPGDVQGPQPMPQGPSQPVGPQQPVGPNQPVGPQQPQGPSQPHGPVAPAIKPLGDAPRAPAQEGPGLFDQGDLFGSIPEQKPAAAPNPDTAPGHLAGQGELDLRAPEQQGDLPLAPGRPQAHQRRAAAQQAPAAQKLKAIAERKKAAKKAPVAAAPATAPIPADAKVTIRGANAEAAKGEIGAALEKYLPGKKPPPPPAAPAAPVAKAKQAVDRRVTPAKVEIAAKVAPAKQAAAEIKAEDQHQRNEAAHRQVRENIKTPSPAKVEAIKAKSKAKATAAVTPAPVEVKAEAAVPAKPAKAPVLERRVERQVLRTAQRIENAKVPEKLKGKWTRDLAALRSTLRAMQAQRINAPFDEKGHYKDKVAPAAEKVTPDSVRAQQAADKAAAAAAAHRDALAKLEAARADAARPTKSKGAKTNRIKKIVAARKAEAEARAASEEAAKEHRRASLLFEGSRAALGATAEAVPPLKAQYAGKYTPDDVKVESEWSPDDQPVEAPYTGPRAHDLLGDKDELAAARAEVRASKFADTVDGLRRRMEATEDQKERKALERQVRDMEYAAELAHDRAADLRERTKQRKAEPTAPSKPISDQEVLKRVTARAQKSETVTHAAEQHGLSVDDMVSMVMADIKRSLEGNQNIEAVNNLPFTELFNRARLRAQKLMKGENARGALDMVRQERAHVDRGRSIRYDTKEDLDAARKAEAEAQIAEEMTPANPDPDARFSHGLPRFTINEDGEIVENPVRRAADQQQDPNRQTEEAAKLAEREEGRAERLQQYMGNMGLGSSASQTTMQRARASKKNGFRAAMAGFMNEDGSLKKWEHISKAAKRIYDEYRGAGQEAPQIVKDLVFHDMDVATRRKEAGVNKGQLTAAEKGVRQQLLDRLQQGEWDNVAAQTLSTAREAAVARTPESVFMNNAPEGGNSSNGIAGESLAEQTDRLNRMVKEFVALQNSGFNMDGKQARSGARKNDAYLGLMKDLIRMTEGGQKPLTYTEIPLKEGFQTKATIAERDRRFRAKHQTLELLSKERTLRGGDLQAFRDGPEAGSSYNDEMEVPDSAAAGTTWRTARRLASADGMYAKAGEPGVIDHSMTGAEALQAAWPNPDPVVGSLVNALSERVGNVPVHVVTAAEMEDLMPGRNANMAYDPDTGIISVKQGLDAGVERAGILEELWHAATAEAIYNDPELRAMGTELQKVFVQNNPGYSAEHMRYFSEMGELSAHGMLNPEFKARIDGIPLPAKVAERLGVRPKTSMLQAIFQRVLKFLGLRPETKEATLLEGIMHWNQKLYQATRPGSGIDDVPERAMASMADLPVIGKAVQNARTAASNQAPEARRTLLGLLYTTDITQKYGGLFHWDTGKKYLRLAGALNPVHQFELATRKRAAATKRMEQADGPMLDRHRALVVHDPKAATAMHKLAIDATTAGIDPTGPAPARARQDSADGRHAKRQHEQLQARYNALTPEAKAVFNGMRDSVKAKAVASAREAIVDIARRRWQNAHDKTKPGQTLPPGIPPQPLSPLQERELADRMMSHEYAPPRKVKQKDGSTKLSRDYNADELLLGEQGMAFARDFQTAIHSQKFYLPLSRQGEYVITGFRTDYKADNFFDNEADAEAFANRAVGDGVPLAYGIQRAAFAPDGTQINVSDASDTPGATIKHWVKLQPQITEMFETRSEALARQKEYEKLPAVKISGVEQRKQGSLAYQRELPPTLQAQITRAVESMASNDKDKAALSEMLQEAYTRFMPGANVRHATIRRRNVKGASEDMLRAMGAHTISSAQFRGSLQYGAFQRAGIQAQEDVTDAERFTAGGKRDNHTRLQVTAELRARQHSTEADASASSPFWKGVQRYVAVHYLASPSYALLQLTQTPLMGPGVMARLFPHANDAEIIGALHHGHKAVGGISGTFWDLGKEKFGRAWRKWADANPENVEFLERVKRNVAETNPAMAKEYGALLDEMARRGVIDETAGLETTQMVKDLNAGALKRGWTLVEDLSRAFPASAEVYNRSSVAVAAYQLARDKGMSVEQATELADQAILGIHFDYSAHNAPRLMNEANKYGGGVLSPFLTFKKYVAAVYGQMGLALVNSVRGQSPEVRRAARRQFTRMMVAHGAAAGVMGLPWEPIKIALGAVALLTGKDEPWDIEDDLRDALIKQFGGGADGVKWANTILHGMPQLLNWDVGDRVGLENLMFGRGPDDFSPDSLKKYGFDLVAGAAGGALGNVALGLKTARDTGNLRKAAEQMAPKFIKDALAAYEIASGGKKNAKGEDVAEGLLGPSDAVWRALGFNSATEKNIQRERSNRFQEQRIGTRDRARLHKEIIKNREAGNTANEDAIIAAHNEKHPDYPITEKSLKSAASRINGDAEPGKKYLGVKVPKGGLSPSKYVPELSGGQIMQDREIGGARAYAPTKDQITSPAMQAITGAVSQNEHPLFASIIKAEGTARDGDPYNEVLGYGAYGRPSKPLTDMTLREVYNFGLKMRQAQAARGVPWRKTSSASGAFQIVGETMKNYMAEAGLDWDSKFDRYNQQQLALVIAEKQGVKPSTWEGFRRKPWLLAQARRHFNSMEGRDV